MKLGIYLNAQHPAGDDPARRFAETLEQARLIHALGFDSIWGGEHHATPGFRYFPLLPMLVSEMLLAQHAAGATHLTMRVGWPGMPQADVLAGIELLGREVLPEVRRRTRS